MLKLVSSAWVLLFGLLPISTAGSNFAFYGLLILAFFWVFNSKLEDLKTIFIGQPFISFLILILVILASGFFGKNSSYKFIFSSIKYLELFAVDYLR